jgi:hypothetical protein
MLPGLLAEIVRRRLWPIPVVALLVAVAAPLLFLKSSSGAPAASRVAQTAPDAGAVKQLPVRARDLLKTNEAPRRAKNLPKAADPFQAPKSATPKTTTTASTSTGAAGAAAASAAAPKQDPVPVVITDSTGKKTKGTISTTTSKDSKSTDATTSDAKSSSSQAGAASYVAVDVRYAKAAGGHVRRAIPRLQPFTGGGRVLASFVKYSPTRNKATFAISPNTIVTGPVHCRKIDGLCRYVDLSAGRHVQLTIGTPDGTIISRRLAVVHLTLASGSAPRSPIAGACLLKRLTKLGLGDPAVLSNVCD